MNDSLSTCVLSEWALAQLLVQLQPLPYLHWPQIRPVLTDDNWRSTGEILFVTYTQPVLSRPTDQTALSDVKNREVFAFFSVTQTSADGTVTPHFFAQTLSNRSDWCFNAEKCCGLNRQTEWKNITSKHNNMFCPKALQRHRLTDSFMAVKIIK